MKTFLYILFFSIVLLNSNSLLCQQIKEITIGKIQSAEIDSRDNIHIVKTNTEIASYSPQGKFLRSFIPKNRSQATHIDVTNAFKLFFFFKDIQECLFTDRYYTPLLSIDFYELGFENIICSTPSTNGDLWILEEGVNEIFKYSIQQHQNILNISLNQYLQKDEIVNTIKEYHHQLIVFSNKYIHIFDQTGNKIDSFKKPQHCKAEILSGDYLWMVTKSEIINTNIFSKKSKSAEFNDIHIEQFLLSEKENTCYIFSEGKLYFYELNDLFGDRN